MLPKFIIPVKQTFRFTCNNAQIKIPPERLERNKS